ncbi:hypothetical protein LG329_00685 [Virgibacillus necropolis]|uniref:DUF6115 domain-containing protein n=1 Tax=Virgibacillus necropolis TaxID=163877 RepID=UPI00384EAD39
MTSFLLIISFLLHIVAFIAIYQLYKQAQLPKQESTSQDMMELFELYLSEIKEENKRLEETLLDRREYNPKGETNPIPQFKEKPEHQEHIADDTYTAPEVDDDVQYETSLQAKVLQLHDQGLASGEIARKLNKGKTEVDLIVKLHAKN